jgi:anti-anti-sigma regulatory factor
LDRAYAQIGQEVKTILLNFGGVDLINSTGIAVLIGLIVQDSRRVALAGLLPE